MGGGYMQAKAFMQAERDTLHTNVLKSTGRHPLSPPPSPYIFVGIVNHMSTND